MQSTMSEEYRRIAATSDRMFNDHGGLPQTDLSQVLLLIALELKALRLLLEEQFTKAPVLRYVLPETYCGTPAMARADILCRECGGIITPFTGKMVCQSCINKKEKT